jgi:diguanylate cyclase (GGDEF)-like protein/PAS domain S-box-containing protein
MFRYTVIDRKGPAMIVRKSGQAVSANVVIFASLTIMIFLLEMLVMYLLTIFVPDTHDALLDFVDAFLLSILSAPFIWALIARPLRFEAKNELERANSVLDSLVDAVICFNERGVITSTNPSARKMFNHKEQDTVGQNIASLIPDIGSLGMSAAVTTDNDGIGTHALGETFGHTGNGMHFPVAISVSRLEQKGHPTFIAIIHDISRRRKAEERIEEQRDFIENLVQNSAVPTFVLGADHRVMIWNRACEELTGVKADAMLGKNESWQAFYDHKRPVLADLVIDDDLTRGHELYGELCKSTLIPDGVQVEGWYRNLNGKDRYIFFNAAPIRNGNGELLAVIQSVEDKTERKRYKEQLEQHASHDVLTDLPNRNLLADRIQQALHIARRKGRQVAVFFIDLDNFKHINDNLEHDAGDLLLKEMAVRLNRTVRAGDTLARLGGDEFVIVVSDLAEAAQAAHLAAKLQAAIAEPLILNDREFILTCSIGISMFPRDGEDAQALLKNADIAMYRAKEQGRNNSQYYSAEMNARSLTHMNLENLLRHALEKNELMLYYQPKVNLRTGKITGMEALIRWQSPELGMVSPAEFIQIAEETGLIKPIGEWVVRTACRQNKAWQDAHLTPLTVAVNVSARQFREKNLSRIVGEALRETGLAPHYLEIELTESLVMHNVETVAAILAELKEMGISLAMDDFGTGYSSLSCLKRFPFDKLKIDQSFIRDITTVPDSAAIARTVIAMAHNLHMKVIAEGVETEGQLNYLFRNDCDEIQGYFFSLPLPPADFEQLLRAGRCLEISSRVRLSPERTILIVDDEPAVAEVLADVLASDGYHVLVAANALQGFELLANHQVAVVIADQRMPGISGSEFLGRVTELYPDCVRMVISGFCDLDSVTTAINCGAIYKFLHKPWKADEILMKIDDAFRYYKSLHNRTQHLSATDEGVGEPGNHENLRLSA